MIVGGYIIIMYVQYLFASAVGIFQYHLAD